MNPFDVYTSMLFSGFRGALHKARTAKKLLDDANVPYGLGNRGRFADACTVGVRLHYAMSDLFEQVNSSPKNTDEDVATASKNSTETSTTKTKARATSSTSTIKSTTSSQGPQEILRDFWKALAEGKAQLEKLDIAEPRRSKVLALVQEAIGLGPDGKGDGIKDQMDSKEQGQMDNDKEQDQVDQVLHQRKNRQELSSPPAIYE